MRKPKLTEADVRAILDLRRWAEETPYATRVKEVRARENAMPEAAKAWWYNEPSAVLDAELRRWKPAYRVEKTRAGYRVFRLLVTRGIYRVKPSRTGLTREQADEYLGRMVRC